MKTIFIGGIQRSGGSLLARLFDGHPDIASYPVECSFPVNNKIYPVFENYTGIPLTMPLFDPTADKDIFEITNTPSEKPKVILKFGKEKEDLIGVRRNYLEKEYYDTVKTDFDFFRFKALFTSYAEVAKTIEELYDAKHRAYFAAWDNGMHSGSMKFVSWHSSSGIYLTNIDRYFSEFKDSFFIHPLRDIMGYIASEKTRLTRQYYGSRRFPKMKMPNIFVKKFKNYDLEAQIRGWMATLTRVVLLQERFGVRDRFFVVRYENIANDAESVMRSLCEKIGLDFHNTLLEPTIGGYPWGGNSHQGKQRGINKDLSSYYPQVLTSQEIRLIDRSTAPIREYLDRCKETPADLGKIRKKHLYDYEYQKRYFDDEEKLFLYYALVNSGRRKITVKNPDFTAIIAFLYKKIIHLIHIPRLLKLRFFHGWGKQNYT